MESGRGVQEKNGAYGHLGNSYSATSEVSAYTSRPLRYFELDHGIFMKARVAIIGAGPGGLAAARYLREHGFSCAVFEQSSDIGGQWNSRSVHSGIWPGMRTNTSRVLTRFSDLPHESGLATYPTNEEMLAYFKRYAGGFGVIQDVRLNARVEHVERSADGYAVRYKSASADSVTETFQYVVVASGRYNHPSVPQVAGLESFSGSGGVIHSFRYKDSERYRGLRVLVGGCAISALEIASDLAMLGAKVVSCYRRQRYVLPKLFAGVPTDHLAYTRFEALCAEVFPPDVAANNLKQLVLRANGSPEQFGAFKPADDIGQAGITLGQYFLPLVAEGRISVKPWISTVAGRRVTFTDGTQDEFDGIIFATGYDISLPFLSSAIRKILNQDRQHIDLFKFTFHPELPGLAFVGMHDQGGPYIPPLELQARWIAYVWSGAIAAPSSEEIAHGIANYRARRGQPQKQAMHTMALLFAGAAGVEPVSEDYPEIARALLFGPLSPASFRLVGPDLLANATALCAEDAAAFGAITSTEFRAEEAAMLEALRNRRQVVSGISAKAG
jgi:dimethylaniline monooxygenase (N-oxide forming)